MRGFDTSTSRHVLPPMLEQDLRDAAGDAEAALRLAPSVVQELDTADGDVRRQWEVLAGLGAIDLTVARALEPHIDAATILQQAHESESQPAITAPHGATWGVFAAEGPGTRLVARQSADGHWALHGEKPWCSLAGSVSHALITAWTSDHGRTLFAVSLSEPGVTIGAGNWVSRGLSGVRTVPISFADVPAQPIGGEDWYLSRPGFALGGIGVAAVWWGAAASLVTALRDAYRVREPDQIALYQLGRADSALHAAGAVLADTARQVEARGDGPVEHAWAEALRVRCIVHDACETVLTATAHALGPAPLTQDEEHARRVADLQVYLRQHKPERDLAGVGRGVLDGLPAVWTVT